MNFFTPTRRFNPLEPELMDRPDVDPKLLKEDLRHLRSINRLFGGLSSLRGEMRRFFNGLAPADEITILDLATGSADQPVSIVRLAQSLGKKVRIVAVDQNPLMLESAKEQTKGYGEISLERRSLLALKYPDKSFDVVTCSLALHHFSDEEAIGILRSMHRISRVGWIVNDLKRSWTGAAAAWIWSHLTTRNPITRHDSFASVLRGFTEQELRAMAGAVGVRTYRIKSRPFFRILLVGEHDAR